MVSRSVAMFYGAYDGLMPLALNTILHEKPLGHFTFWLRPWLSLLAEPKTMLSRR